MWLGRGARRIVRVPTFWETIRDSEEVGGAPTFVEHSPYTSNELIPCTLWTILELAWFTGRASAPLSKLRTRSQLVAASAEALRRLRELS